MYHPRVAGVDVIDAPSIQSRSTARVAHAHATRRNGSPPRPPASSLTNTPSAHTEMSYLGHSQDTTDMDILGHELLKEQQMSALQMQQSVGQQSPLQPASSLAMSSLDVPSPGYGFQLSSLPQSALSFDQQEIYSRRKSIPRSASISQSSLQSRHNFPMAPQSVSATRKTRKSSDTITPLIRPATFYPRRRWVDDHVPESAQNLSDSGASDDDILDPSDSASAADFPNGLGFQFRNPFRPSRSRSPEDVTSPYGSDSDKPHPAFIRNRQVDTEPRVVSRPVNTIAVANPTPVFGVCRTISRDNTAGKDCKRSEAMALLGSRQNQGRRPGQIMIEPGHRKEVSTRKESEMEWKRQEGPSTGQFVGLPPEWSKLLNSSAITKEDYERNPQTVFEVLDFYSDLTKRADISPSGGNKGSRTPTSLHGGTREGTKD